VIFNGKIKELMFCDTSKILAELPSYDSPLWAVNKGRQEDNAVHTDTLNILIKGVGKYWKGVVVPPKIYTEYPVALTEAVCEIADKVGEVLGGMVTNATLIMLPAGKKVYLHKDKFYIITSLLNGILTQHTQNVKCAGCDVPKLC
jgi:hypothetical protein